jgi:PAS domain S-box-containing protein
MRRPGAVEDAALFEAFFETAVDMLCIADLDGCLRVVNPAWRRVLGWAPEELCGRPYLDFVHPDDVEATVAAAGALARGQTVQTFFNRYRCKDGRYRDLG